VLEAVFQQLLIDCPEDATNLAAYGSFLENTIGDLTRAEEMYRKALKSDPKHYVALRNYATFLEKKGDVSQAEKMYQRALVLRSRDLFMICSYGYFLESVKGSYDEAEAIYVRGMAIDRTHIPLLNHYSTFLVNRRQRYDEAETMFETILSMDANHGPTLCQYAGYRYSIKRDYKQAELLFNRAVAADPTSPVTLINFAVFLQALERVDEAEGMYKRAIDVAPAHVNAHYMYGSFLKAVRSNFTEAELCFQQALAIDDRHMNTLNSYAILMWKHRPKTPENMTRVKAMAAVMLDIDPGHQNSLGILHAVQQYEHGLWQMLGVTASSPNRAVMSSAQGIPKQASSVGKKAGDIITSSSTSKCGKPECQEIGTKQCGKCLLVSYCSRECQVAHFKIHKKQCKEPTPPTKSI
jgi:Tfp pilus assembly protein PilF